MTDFKSELREILNDLTVKECYGRVEDEDINKVADDIIALFINKLPKKEINRYYLEYTYGYNQCLADIKGEIE